MSKISYRQAIATWLQLTVGNIAGYTDVEKREV
jgi:hypothetical protein